MAKSSVCRSSLVVEKKDDVVEIDCSAFCMRHGCMAGDKDYVLWQPEGSRWSASSDKQITGVKPDLTTERGFRKITGNK